jgi:predicted DNA-binding transcriptional regulator AlpA
MPEYTFTLILDGEPDLDALYEAGCDDATFGEVDDVHYAEFARQASSLADAVLSAIHDVESVGCLRALRVEPDDLVTAAEIAKRLGRTRESVRLLIAGRRGSGDFPPPVSHLRSRTRLWRWSDVAAWAKQLTPEQEHEARLLATANAVLELRNQGRTLPEKERQALGALV